MGIESFVAHGLHAHKFNRRKLESMSNPNDQPVVDLTKRYRKPRLGESKNQDRGDRGRVVPRAPDNPTMPPPPPVPVRTTPGTVGQFAPAAVTTSSVAFERAGPTGRTVHFNPQVSTAFPSSDSEQWEDATEFDEDPQEVVQGGGIPQGEAERTAELQMLRARMAELEGRHPPFVPRSQRGLDFGSVPPPESFGSPAQQCY